jgi:uncharacterized protein (DUF1800 family)
MAPTVPRRRKAKKPKRPRKLKVAPAPLGAHRLKRPKAGGAQTPMTQAMVDRMFWRAGFGPSAADRTNWTGKSVGQLVEWLISTPQGALVGAEPVRGDGSPLQPNASDTDLVLSWVDRMVRAPNPLVERLTFFWHRHFATSRADVSPPQLMTQQNALLRRYADLGANPEATFTTLAYEVGEGPAMLRFLTGEDSTRRNINENYGRELMELFCLGVVDAAGQPNYSETDVKELAKATAGWQIDDDDPDNPLGFFNASRSVLGPKTIFGQVGDFVHRSAADVVMAHRAHAPYLVTKLWLEFIATPPDTATLGDLVTVYMKSGRKIRPVVERILLHPRIFESLAEPNLMKPPIVYSVGLMRQLGLSIKDTRVYDGLQGMGQLPYFPPTVAGWEGGLTWLNTNTSLSRFGLAQRLVSLPEKKPTDVPVEAADAAVTRAHTEVGAPWIADGTKAALVAYAGRASVKSAGERDARQRVLRAFILGGPDAQVM